MDIKEIIEKYNAGAGLESLALESHMGKKRLRGLLIENGVVLRHTCGVKPKEKHYVVSDWKVEKYPLVEGSHYIAEYKNDGSIFNDYMNSGGYLTSYIKEMVFLWQ